MAGANDKTRFLREGLFAKYVVSLVGLVVFVLAVNGAMESWISYRATKTRLTDGLEDKAQGRRTTDRAVDLRTRAPDQLGDAGASQRHAGEAPRRLRKLLHQVSVVNQLFRAQRRAAARCCGSLAPVDARPAATPTSPATCASPTRSPAASATRRPGFSDRTAVHVDLGGAFRFQRRGHRGRARSPAFSPSTSHDAQVGKAAFAYVVNMRGLRAGDVLERA